MQFHERLAKLIVESKLSHKEIEKLTGISAGNISYSEMERLNLPLMQFLNSQNFLMFPQITCY